MNLLSSPKSNPKIAKNLDKGVLTAPLHLSPYTLSGYNTCPMASQGCAAACLNTAGRGGMFKKGETTNAIQRARLRKTLMFFEQREDFFELLIKDIKKLQRKAKKESLSCGVRLNATSDIMWEVFKVAHEGKEYRNIFEVFPDIQFYDYTAIPKRALSTKLIKNYHLTFSLKEDNDKAAEFALRQGLNVAAVFRKELPKVFSIGKTQTRVINGDEHDYRPADGSHKIGVIVGLKAKGKAKHDTTGFVR